MTKRKINVRLTNLLLILLFMFTVTGCSKTKASSDKVKVGISWAADEIDEDAKMYADAVIKAGGEPVFLPLIQNDADAQKAIKDIDVVILTGGDDVDPALYNEEPHEKLEELNKIRDISDVALIKASLEEDMPMLGTCRGMQLLNSLSGGTLYQDLLSQNPTDIIHRDPEKKDFVKHPMTLEDGNILADAIGKSGEFEVNAWHHQAIKDLGENLEVVATSPDGIIEAVVKTDKSFVIGVQYHPEELISHNDEGSLNLYKALVNEGLKHRK